jgi:hypothetical protein
MFEPRWADFGREAALWNDDWKERHPKSIVRQAGEILCKDREGRW